jgi:D-alanine-D-alanine ligase-like ATP-grasp enzyme
VYTKEEYYQQAQSIFELSPVMVIEEFQSGNDYRIVVLDDEVISAYQRIPLNVLGNGKNSIAELLIQKQDAFTRIGREEEIDTSDERIQTVLKRKNLTLNSVLPEGERISLLDNANLSTGGDSQDFTKEIHEDFKQLAVNITKDMGLRFCGVDVITADITKPLEKYSIIEINGAPGLDNYASMGKEQAKRVEDLYLRILLAMGK